MKQLKSLGLVTVLLVLVLTLIGLMLSNEYTVVRSIVIDASPNAIHTYTNDLKQWPKWTPWQDNASTVTTYGDISEGVGAVQLWTGEQGRGSLNITASSADTGVEYDLIFDDVAVKTSGSLHYTLQDNGTVITWTMNGSLPYPVVGSYLALMMDSKMGQDFERGLVRLKTLAEAP